MSGRHRCEDCGEAANHKTSDGVWLCEGDWDRLWDQHFADDYSEIGPETRAAQPKEPTDDQ